MMTVLTPRPIQIIYLNGPTSAGKTTLAKVLQNLLSLPYLHIGIDRMINMMPEKMNDWKGGEAPLGFSVKASTDPKGTRIQCGPYADMISMTLKEVVLTLAKSGHHLVIDDVADGKQDVDHWKALLKSFNVLYIGLTAPIETLEERERNRLNRMPGLAKGQLLTTHTNVEYDLLFDTAIHSAEAIAKEIVDHIVNPIPMRDEIYALIAKISPSDELEALHIQETLSWIASGIEIFRVAPPDCPRKHLVCYFVLVDRKRNKILLLDHVKSGLWLPAGGHVEPMEHPKDAVKREMREELFLEADFLFSDPFFLTSRETVGTLHAIHHDVTLWYVLNGDSSQPIKYDNREFLGAKWISLDAIPVERVDPCLSRFVSKLVSVQLSISDADRESAKTGKFGVGPER